jgi:hypothetical protein
MPIIPAAEASAPQRRRLWPILLAIPLIWLFGPRQIREDACFADGGGCSVECFGLRVNEQCRTVLPPHPEKYSPSDLDYATYRICSSICFGQTERRPGCPEPE